MRNLLKSLSRRGSGNAVVILPALAITLLNLGLLWSAGCTPNDTFDPESVANNPPVVKMAVSSVDGSDLNSTSYFQRTFSWFGSDTDGWVQRYFISIRLEASVDAPWDTTTSTDTTMTFTTDDQGNAEATFLIVCQDDRGALSDTFVQFIPLKNFPPAMNFQSDFDPLVNMQREVNTSGAIPDTTFWNWGATNFRMFALDLDGSETLDDFYLYTVAAVEPTETYDFDDPLADPLTTWVRVPFPTSDEVREFEVFVNDVPPGVATFRVKTSDESNSTAELAYTWEVRAPSSNVLYVRDNSSSAGRALYNEFLDWRYGPGNWDLYDFWFGYPDHNFVLLESMRKFEAVMWSDGGVTSDLLKAATTPGAALESYLEPTDGSMPGRLLLISTTLTGSNSDIPNAFLKDTMGINPTGSPQSGLLFPAGKMALGAVVGMPSMFSAVASARGIGLSLYAGTEVLYRMEYCKQCLDCDECDVCEKCYSQRPPYDPIVAARRPLRSVDPLASFVGISMQIESFNRPEVLTALEYILGVEMGVSAP